MVVPSGVAPSRNVTGPEGVPAPGATTLTVAVNVTARPIPAEGVGDVSAVLVAALPIVCASTVDRLGPSRGVPP